MKRVRLIVEVPVTAPVRPALVRDLLRIFLPIGEADAKTEILNGMGAKVGEIDWSRIGVKLRSRAPRKPRPTR